MQVGQILLSKGFVTQDKCVLGLSLLQIEKTLGYKEGRLSEGAWVGVCLKLPDPTQFDLKGYSQVPGHKHIDLEGYDTNKLKQIALSVMRIEGRDRLVKLFPLKLHNNALSNDEQYPPGSGIPQWSLTTPFPFRITTFLSNYPTGTYHL